MNLFLSKVYLILIATMLSLGWSCFAQQWQLVWSDEFDGTVINDSIWTHEIGGNGWGNNELQYYTDRDTNSYVRNGYLVIQALKENYSAWNYTSARLKTQSKKFFKYGKVLARIKLPYGQGMWPAFWMLGESFPVVGWPDCGEIDIVELIGGPTGDNTVHGTAHWEDANGQHAQYGNSYTLSSGIFADGFHLFSIVWDDQKIRWYVDNHLYHEIDITPASLSEFHEDFFIILNVAVGGNWPGPPDSTTVFPQKMEVDYVRVYKDVPSSVEDDSNFPTQFSLFQNYPNPFNPITNIRFSLPEKTKVSIKIYDILGTLVDKIVNSEFEAGFHNIEFNASQFTSGMYIYRIETKNFTDVKKMLLLK